MADHSKKSEKYQRLRDIILGNEEHLRNYLPRLPLAYFRFRALTIIQNDIGYVSIIKSDDSKAHLHPELGHHFELPELASAWSAANTDADRKAAINQYLENTVDHEAKTRRFLSDVTSGRLKDAFHLQPCCGCLCALGPTLRFVKYNKVRFCHDCAPYLSSGLIDFEVLDQIWLGIIPAWEDERTGEHKKVLRLSNPQSRLFLDPQRVDDLAQKIHWITMPHLDNLWLGWTDQMRQDYCRYELSRLLDMINRKWPNRHVARLNNWGQLPLDLYGIQYRPREEIRLRLFEAVWDTEGATLLRHAALNPSDPRSRTLRTSKDVRDMFGIDCWRRGDISWMGAALVAAALDHEFQKPGMELDYFGVYHILQDLLHSTVEKEFISMYDRCSTEPWREFIHLAHHYDNPDNSDPRNNLHRTLPEGSLKVWHDNTRQRGPFGFNIVFSDLPHAMALKVFLMREALWAAYIRERRFTDMVHQFFVHHSVYFLTKQSPNDSIIPTWVRELKANPSTSAFNYEHGRHPMLYPGWKVSAGGQLAWLCLEEDCHCEAAF